MSVSEAPPPKRGLTAQEPRSEATAPEREVAAAQSMPRRFAAAPKPRFLLARAGGYPVVIKQCLQFCPRAHLRLDRDGKARRRPRGDHHRARPPPEPFRELALERIAGRRTS